MTKNVDEIEDIDARIGFRCVRFIGNFSVYEALKHMLQIFASRLKLLKSLRGLKVRMVFKSIESSTRISEVYRGIKIFPFNYKEEFLTFLVNKLMKDKRILYTIGNSKEEGSFLGLALIPTDLLFSSKKSSVLRIQKSIRAKIPFQEPEQMLNKIADHLEDILIQELGPERWNKVLEMKAGSGVLRSGPIKSWPLVGDAIYMAYTMLLPIYPARAHTYGRQSKWKGEKAKYPKALTRDLVQVFQERFPEDFKDLAESDVRRAIQYRRDRGLLNQYLF